MKKLIFFLLVVGITSAANARMVLELAHGDADTLDIVAAVGFSNGDDIYFAVVGDTSEVIISGGTVGTVAPPDTIIRDDPQAYGFCAPPLDGIWGFIGGVVAAPLPAGVIIEEINWSLVGGATYAEVYLIVTPDFATFDTLDTITVPEPMTVVLLGLGGLLALLRRR